MKNCPDCNGKGTNTIPRHFSSGEAGTGTWYEERTQDCHLCDRSGRVPDGVKKGGLLSAMFGTGYVVTCASCGSSQDYGTVYKDSIRGWTSNPTQCHKC